MLHLRHIATGGDPFEHGTSRPLDFGHWAAHKLEQITNHRLGHGEAVGSVILVHGQNLAVGHDLLPVDKDIAHGAVYLASDESRWVTGILLPIDGGLVALRQWPR